jgi:signal transduction histidine kinase
LKALGSGGLVVPQIGQDAGQEVRFVLQDIDNDSCLRANAAEEVERSFWREIHAQPRVYDLSCRHAEGHLACVLAPAAFWFDRPIGYFWAIVERQDARDASAALEYAANFLALTARSEIACNAIEQLSKPTWIAASTSKRTATEVAESCLAALACSAIIIWELNEIGQTLRTMALAGNAGPNLDVDMRLGNGLAGRCALDNNVIVVDDLLDAEQLHREGLPDVRHPAVVRQRGWRSAIFVPLDIGGRNAGVLAAYAPRPRGFSVLDRNIALAFAQRLCAGYVHAQRIEHLTDMERKLSLEAPAIEAGIIAMERVHDADNHLILAQSQLSTITSRFRHDKAHPVNQAAHAASQHVDEAHKTIKVLVRRAKVKNLVFTLTDLKVLVDHTLTLVKLQAEGIGVKIYLSCPEGLQVKVDKDQLPRVFKNLLDNSLYFLETDRKAGEKKIEITVAQIPGSVLTTFTDNGPGIAPYDIEKIFDYFFTTKGSRGMGFGLAIARSIVHAHGGSITVTSKWGYETQFEITLPSGD